MIETDSIIEQIKPCPELSVQGKIDHYRYAKHYLVDKWIQENYVDSFIGAMLLVFAMILSIGSCVFHLLEKNREKSNKITPAFSLIKTSFLKLVQNLVTRNTSFPKLFIESIIHKSKQRRFKTKNPCFRDL